MGGDPSWTPNLDAFARQADWVGTTVVASSAPVVSLASLMTGVSPWQHQILNHKPTLPRPGAPLLAQELSRAGYRTVAHVPSEYGLDQFGLLSGFEKVEEMSIPGATSSALRLAAPDGELHWLHLREANVTYQRRDAYLPRLASRSNGLPEKISIRRLLPFADPNLQLPPSERALVWELFGHEVAWADHQLGELLAALRESPAWGPAWIVLTATQGFELGEHGQVLYGQNLGREAIEVPLLIKLPDSRKGELSVPDSQRVGQPRLWATLVEAAGGEVAPVHAPSLFRAGARGIVSALYQHNGVNVFSLLKGDLQLIRSVEFAPEEPEFYLAQLKQSGGQAPLSEPADRIFRRLEQAFLRTRPFSGRPDEAPPCLRLERWTDEGTMPVDDPRLAAELALELRRRWRGFVDRERTPREESTLSTTER
ncbi:MAG: hypothetical protein AAF560_04560 [Acidobacteriota bacterium]